MIEPPRASGCSFLVISQILGSTVCEAINPGFGGKLFLRKRFSHRAADLKAAGHSSPGRAPWEGPRGEFRALTRAGRRHRADGKGVSRRAPTGGDHRQRNTQQRERVYHSTESGVLWDVRRRNQRRANRRDSSNFSWGKSEHDGH